MRYDRGAIGDYGVTMKDELDALDQQLLEGIIALDVKCVREALKRGADVQHQCKRTGMPIAPTVTAATLSHRMRDVLRDPTIKVVRKFPQKALDFLRITVRQRREELGRDECKQRIDAICDAIVKKMPIPPELRKMFLSTFERPVVRRHK